MHRGWNQEILFSVNELPSGRLSDKSLDEWYRNRGFQIIAGVDEAGRGALAGPVCAAAVVLGPERISGLNDSKLLSPERRDFLFEAIWNNALSVGIAFVSPEIVDLINILQASLQAMKIAVEMLGFDPEIILVDGDRLPGWKYNAVAITGGDKKSDSIMAASIIAKVSRDRYMKKVAKYYPDYGFESHKGYAVKMHLKALSEKGLCPIHRRSYAPCGKYMHG